MDWLRIRAIGRFRGRRLFFGGEVFSGVVLIGRYGVQCFPEDMNGGNGEAKCNAPDGWWIALGENTPGVASIQMSRDATFYRRRRVVELPRGMQRPSIGWWTTSGETTCPLGLF
jgi:hypothetical protein